MECNVKGRAIQLFWSTTRLLYCYSPSQFFFLLLLLLTLSSRTQTYTSIDLNQREKREREGIVQFFFFFVYLSHTKLDFDIFFQFSACLSHLHTGERDGLCLMTTRVKIIESESDESKRQGNRISRVYSREVNKSDRLIESRCIAFPLVNQLKRTARYGCDSDQMLFISIGRCT